MPAAKALLASSVVLFPRDHDSEAMYLDSFLKLSSLEGEDISEQLQHWEKIGEKSRVTFILSVSMDADELPESVKKDVIISL